MIPRSRSSVSSRLPVGRLAAVLALAALATAACGSASTSFDPTSTCGPDGKFAGAYPSLEALLPTSFEGKAPTTVDSGRNCSDAAIGSLIVHGAAGVEFAGATWDLGSESGGTSVVFALPGHDLPAAWIAEFYEIGAQTAKKTDNITTSTPAFDGTGPAFRLDTLNDLSLQSVVTWQDGSYVRVVLVATSVSPGASRAAHDDLVTKLVAATVGVMGGT